MTATTTSPDHSLDATALPWRATEYEAVRMPPALVHAAVRSTDPRTLAQRLDWFLEGPVACAPAAGWYLALTRPMRPKWYQRCDRVGLGDFVRPAEVLPLPHPLWVSPASEPPFCSRTVQPGALSEAFSVALLLGMGIHELYWQARHCNQRGEATYASHNGRRILVSNLGPTS
ncbi:hypothetical protein ACIO3O_05260 [Streptomyces sp. NPDC087440]|uniref:hypothetical protein n=1 Tax=Streptomyces sp. NPDC087440 TaxID=3365790 RepID=UPI0037F5DBC7